MEIKHFGYSYIVTSKAYTTFKFPIEPRVFLDIIRRIKTHRVMTHKFCQLTVKKIHLHF